MINGNGRIVCDYCGKFVSYKDLENKKATHKMTLPDSDLSVETWESLCRKCKEKEAK